LVVKKRYVKVDVPVCYAWKENLERIKNGKKERLKNFLNDVCIQGNTDMFADMESQDNAELFCYCIPDDLFIDKGLDPKQRFYEYDPKSCEYFLQNPALFYANAFDLSCNPELEGKYVFYNAEELQEYVLWEREVLKKHSIYAEEESQMCDKEWNDPRPIYEKEINKIRNAGLNVFSLNFLFLRQEINQDIKSLQSCYYNPYYKDKLYNKGDIKKMYIQSYELMKINNNYKFVKNIKETSDLNIFNPFDDKEKKLTGSYNLVSLLPIEDKSVWVKLGFNKDDYASLNIPVILVRVEKKDGEENNFCYASYDNSFMRTLIVYAPFAVAEGALSLTGIGTIPAASLHFISGFVSEVVNNYFESKAKWPKGEGMFE